MKSKILILFLLLCLMGLSQELKYKEISNNPDAGFFKINIDPLNVLASRSRITFSGQTGIRLYTAGFLLNLSGDFHYLDNLASASDRMYGESVYAPQKSRNFNALASYLFRWDKNGYVKIYLKSSAGGTGGRGVDHYAKVKLDYKKYFGIEGGLKSGYSYLTYKGSNLNAYDYYNGVQTIITNPFTTYLQYNWLVAGFSTGKIINAEVNFSDFGNRRAMYMTRYYSHVILPLSSELEDVFFTPDNGSATKLTYRYRLDNSALTKIGFRLGYEFIPLKKIVGFGLEAGILPGLGSGGNFYVSTKLSFNFGPRF